MPPTVVVLAAPTTELKNPPPSIDKLLPILMPPLVTFDAVGK
jgi:hypothetical protein